MAISHSPYEPRLPATLEQFDRQSGSRTERLIFNNRFILMFVCLLLTIGLGYSALQLKVQASFEDMMPRSHEFVRNYVKHAESLKGLGNSVRIVVTNTRGDSIYDAAYLRTLRDINDRVFLVPGVDRSFMKSLWMPVVRWTEITADGYRGGSVMPDDFDGSQQAIDRLRANIERAGIVGSLVGNDLKSSMIFVPLLDKDAATGEPLDYKAFRAQIEALKAYEKDGVRIHVIGFAQLIGDLMLGLNAVMTYFVYAAIIAALIILIYTRCWRSTLLVTGCSTVAVLWQTGLMHWLNLELDPFSILVPFLIFAIGVSHGAQKMNGVMQDIGRGAHRYVAARYTFRRLFLAGLTAILADAVGFAVLAIIDIPVIRSLAASASIGVAVLIFTNLILLPVLLSFSGVTPSAALRSIKSLEGRRPIIEWLGGFAEKRRAFWVILGSAMLTAGGFWIATGVQIGDLDSGAPELRPDSRYNLDNAYITEHYQLSSDQFAVIVATPPNGLVDYETLLEMDRLEEMLRELPGVQTTVSAASLSRRFTSAGFEGSLKWETINRDPYVVQDAVNTVYDSNPELLDDGRSVAPVIAFLADHKAETLTRVVQAVQAFAGEHNTENRQFLLAAGTSGIDAATNIVVEKANRTMLVYVYAAVVLLCFITFRSWRAVIVAIVPLLITTVLCEALMVLLGIGMKVATLPVTALGVGIGVDYSLYLLTIHLMLQRQGLSVRDAYIGALSSTGKVVALIGITLSAAVVTWAWSPIKFQADMGILLAFMFLWNMLGALILVPALASYLLPDRKPVTAVQGAESGDAARA